MTDLPDWWGRNASKLPPKAKTPMKRQVMPTKHVRMPRKSIPKNAVKTPGGTRVNTPSWPVAAAPKKPKAPTEPKAPVAAKAPKRPTITALAWQKGHLR